MTGLAPRLERALDRVEVEPDRAVVAGLELEAETPWELSYKLAGALYERLHVGWTEESTSRLPSRDLSLEERLRTAVPYRHTTVPVTLLDTPAGPDGERVALTPEGVRVRLASEPEDPTTLRIAACRPSLSPGFFLVDGPRPLPATRPDLLRVYVHLLRPEDAGAVWESALGVLAEPEASFRMKVLSDTARYPRRDAMVVYLPRISWHLVGRLVRRLDGTSGVAEGTSPFTHQVASGISLAFEAGDTRRRAARLSFGQHRAKAVADGLVAAATSGSDRVSAIVDALREANADPSRPARNLDSPPLPVPGDELGEPTTNSPHLLAVSGTETGRG